MQNQMILTGVDIVEIARIKRAIERWDQRFLHRIYTPGELDYCQGRIESLAARFAAKEAVMKALGTGKSGIGWRDIEVVRNEGQAPHVRLHDKAYIHAQRIKAGQISLSLSHSREYAVAFVVMLRQRDTSA